MKEIVIRHRVMGQGDPIKDRVITTVGCFKFKSPNPYEVDGTKDTQERSMQIKILDILYDNQICSLVYMHDVTKVIGDYQNQS